MKKIVAAVIALHVVGFGLLFFYGMQSTAIGTALLAYTLGIRHAFDADHLVAIDATTRKLIHEHKKANGVGFFFSLGHSTIVFFATILAVAGVGTITQELLDVNSPLKQTGGFIGSLVAGTFLLLLALYNSYILYKIITNKQKHSHGFWSRFMKPINNPAQMYIIGLLFGLGFDTATTIAVLSLSVIGVATINLAIAAISLPIIFTAGMALGDTLSGHLMNKALLWSIQNDKRKTYNITLTTISIIAALAIGIPTLMEL